MIGTTAVTVVVGICYFATCGWIAIWAARRTSTSGEFFVAGRRLGIWTVAIASMASSLSGFTFIGGPGLVYSIGIGAVYIILPAAITGALSAWVLGKRLRLLAEVRGVVTIPEAVGLRFASVLLRRLAGIAIVVATVGYVATNFLALGIIIDAVFQLGRVASILIGAAVVVGYSATGGMLAGVYTDLFQGTIMAVASLAVFVAAIGSGGGLAEQSRTILAADPGWFGPWGHATPVAAMSFFFIFGLGILGQPHVMHKFYMVRDPRKLRWYPAIMSGAMITTLLLFVGVGIAVKASVVDGRIATLANPDDATATFLSVGTPALIAALVLSGVAAAIMSTVNSFLNIAAAALTRDIPGRSAVGDKAMLMRGRWATVAVAALAVVMALASNTLVALLGVFAWGLFASALVPSLGFGLIWEGATRAGAVASMVVALVGTLVLESYLHLSGATLPGGVNAAGVMLLLSLLVFLGVSWLTRARAAADLAEDVRMVMRR